VTRVTAKTHTHSCRELAPARQPAPTAASARPAVLQLIRVVWAFWGMCRGPAVCGARGRSSRPSRSCATTSAFRPRRSASSSAAPTWPPSPAPWARARPRPPSPAAPPCAARLYPGRPAGSPTPCRLQRSELSGRRRAGYSIWTGYSFKAPLLASAVACLIGNLAYSFSYDARALWLLVLARLVTGLGARPAAGLHHAGLRPRRQPVSVPLCLDQARPACARAQRAAGRLNRARALQSLCVCGGVVPVGQGVAGAACAPGAAEHCPPALVRARAAPGSARAVNRSYIALFVPRAERTSASALFVSLSAVGMALGPLLALPLSHFPDLTAFGLTFNKARPPAARGRVRPHAAAQQGPLPGMRACVLPFTSGSHGHGCGAPSAVFGSCELSAPLPSLEGLPGHGSAPPLNPAGCGASRLS